MNRNRTKVALILADTSKWAALAAELKSAASDFAKVVIQRQALSLYYHGQELVRDPANADLIEPLEELRVAYERAFGRPIPPREVIVSVPDEALPNAKSASVRNVDPSS